MKQMPSRLWVIVPVAALVVIAAILVGVFTHPLIALAVFIGGIGAFIFQGLRQIPADPPHRGIPTFRGERYPKILGEGWRFLPFYNVPYIGYGVILVKIEKINFDLTEERVRTPDLAEVRIPVSVTFQPDYEAAENGYGMGLIEYANTGGVSGVKGILSDIIRQELREWAVNFTVVDKKGRRRIEKLGEWFDVVKAQDEAVGRLIKAVAGVDKILTDEEIARIRQGNGAERHPALGIIINRLNVGEIEALGELAKTAEQRAKEKQQRAGEEVELNFVGEQIEKLTDAGLTPVEARRTIQVAQGKITETIQTKTLGITPETFEAVGDAVARARGLGGGQSQRRRRGRGQQRKPNQEGGK